MNLRVPIVLFAATAACVAHGLVIKVDESKGPCRMERNARNGDVSITCVEATGLSVDGIGYRLEVADLDGTPARRIVIPVPPDKPYAPVRVAGGYSISATEPRVPERPAQPKPDPAPPPKGANPLLDNVIAASQPSKGGSADPPPVVTKTKKEEAKADTGATPAAKDPQKKDLQLDYSIPDMPAFTVLGMNPENVQHPRTARALALALKEGIDENGKLKTGLALEFQPFRLYDPTSLLRSYINRPGERPDETRTMNTIDQMVRNMSVSLASAQGSEEGDKSMRLGLGLRIPIFDKSDGRTDPVLRECYGRAKEIFLGTEKVGDVVSDAALDAADKKALAAGIECFKARGPRTAFWNSSAWIVSLGNAWTSDSGNFSDRKTSTRGIWTTYAYGFDGELLGNAAQMIFHLRALDKERVPNPNEEGKFVNQDSRVASMAFKYGVATFNGSLQASYSRHKLEGFANEDKVRKYSLGLEYKITDDLWIVGSVGGERGRVNGENKSFISTSFRYQPAVSKGSD